MVAHEQGQVMQIDPQTMMDPNTAAFYAAALAQADPNAVPGLNSGNPNQPRSRLTPTSSAQMDLAQALAVSAYPVGPDGMPTAAALPQMMAYEQALAAAAAAAGLDPAAAAMAAAAAAGTHVQHRQQQLLQMQHFQQQQQPQSPHSAQLFAAAVAAANRQQQQHQMAAAAGATGGSSGGGTASVTGATQSAVRFESSGQ